jgi:PAS domain S-box-containing protein
MAGRENDMNEMGHFDQDGKNPIKRRAEEALRESEERYRAFFKQAPDSVVFFDAATGEMVEFNDLAHDNLGYTREEFRNLKIPDYEVIESAEEVGKHIEHVVRSGGDIFLTKHRTKNGEIRDIQVSARPVSLGGRTFIQGIWRDVTDQKRAQEALREAHDDLERRVDERTEELRKANEALQEEIKVRLRVEEMLRLAKAQAESANRAKSEFIASVSHEIRTPMNAILGFSNLMKETPLSGVQKDYLDIICQSGDVLMSLIGNILDISQIEAGAVSLASEKFDVRQLVDSTLRMFGPRFEESGIEARYEIEEGLPTILFGDEKRIRQILVNLLGNAVKFTPPGGRIGIRFQTAESSAQKSQEPFRTLKISMRDTGIGIPKEKCESIFEPFSGADTPVRAGYGGVGLGLHIARRLVEMMGGRIWATSKEGEGSEFTFTIVLKEIIQQAAEEASRMLSGHPVAEASPYETRDGSAQITEEPRAAGVRVLVAEDDPSNRKLVEILLQKMGCSVDLASNGREALEKLDAGRYDLCLMDLRMPGLGGLEAAQEIRSRGDSALPIIALTAYAERSDERKCLASGMNDYLAKPVRKKDLEEKVLKWSRRG